MMKPLRKRHLQIWILLAILLPVGIVTAWVSIPQQAKEKLLQPLSAKDLPVTLKTFYSRDSYEVVLQTNADTSEFQLEWLNKQTLTYPTATIYKMPLHDTDITHGKLVGRIEARGNYYFKVDSTFNTKKDSTYQLLLYDFIHKQIIDSITFKKISTPPGE